MEEFELPWEATGGAIDELEELKRGTLVALEGELASHRIARRRSKLFLSVRYVTVLS